MKDFVPYQEALALKELGFNEPCIASYMQSMRFNIHEQNGLHWETITNSGYIKEYPKACTAPTYSQALRWFREKHHLIGTIEYVGGATPETTWWDICVVGHFNTNPSEWTMKYQPYEQAELACLQKLIEIVKNKAI